jgi:hypothetical protein
MNFKNVTKKTIAIKSNVGVAPGNMDMWLEKWDLFFSK